nr:F-box protein At5g49610-like [Ipomoea trifida]
MTSLHRASRSHKFSKRNRDLGLGIGEGLEETRELWLPHSLLVEVLWRLPSKTLAWVRFVSKEWKNIVSDRTFIKLQLKPREQLSGFFFQGRYEWSDGDVKSVSYISVDRDFTKVEKAVLNFLPENVVILSSSNGLICCRSSFPCSKPVLYVCNPLNREWITLQWPNLPKDSSTALIFEPFKSQIDVSTDFQVVTVCQTYIEEDEDEDEDGVQFSFNIYSSQTKLWTKSTEICVCGHNLQKKGCAFVEGVIFWLTNGDHILMFDPEKELSCLVMQPFPASQLNFRPGMCVGEAEGRLQYVLFSEDGLQLWELEDMFSSHWSVKHFISLEELERENPKCMYHISEKLESHLTTDTFPWINPLSFKDTTLLLRISTNIYAFNFDTKKAKLLCPYSALGPNSMFSPIVIPYTMSLVPIA